MARPRRDHAPSMRWLHVRLSERERLDLEEVARDNGVPSISEVIREAVNEYVGDYRERRVFRDTKRPQPSNLDT